MSKLRSMQPPQRMTPSLLPTPTLPMRLASLIPKLRGMQPPQRMTPSLLSTGDGSIATGASANATGDGSTATGNMSIASGRNSVALGANAVARKDNEVNIGIWKIGAGVTAGIQTGTRTLSGLSDGINPDEAVNKGQL
ncbi:hypothetical protein NWX27_004916, partial [Salmonella enterica]|nr:hypothetical protein [Salmonella enterica]